MTRIYAIAAAAVTLASLGGVFLASILMDKGDDQFAQCRASTVAGSGDLGGPFTLVSETGETVTDTQVIDQPVLLYFGYTFCPDVCPADAARNAEAVDILNAGGHSVKPVFITVDPERDTPQVLTEFTDYMHPRMLGLTGSEAQITAAKTAYRAYSQIRKTSDDDDFYLVDHSPYTYLTLPGHGFVEFFRREHTAQQMADTVACYVEHAG